MKLTLKLNEKSLFAEKLFKEVSFLCENQNDEITSKRPDPGLLLYIAISFVNFVIEKDSEKGERTIFNQSYLYAAYANDTTFLLNIIKIS